MEKKYILSLIVLQLTVVAAAANDDCPEKIGIIDTHCHYLPDFYSKLLKDNNISAGGFKSPAWNVTSHFAMMETLDVTLSVVSVSTPGAVLKKGMPIDDSRKLARQLNEYGYNLAKQYPTKFKFFASLTLPDVEGSVAEAIYALDTLKAAGVILMASSFSQVLGSSELEPLYAELNKRNAVVFVHPGQTPCPCEVDFSANSEGLAPWIVDFLLDTTRAAANLIHKNVTQKYPYVKFILAHSGGFLPFAASRVIRSLQLKNWTDSEALSQLQKFYVDTALTGDIWALPSTLALLSASHITYGSDFPYASMSAIVANSLGAERYIQQNLGGEVLKQIRYKSAAQLFSHSDHNFKCSQSLRNQPSYNQCLTESSL